MDSEQISNVRQRPKRTIRPPSYLGFEYVLETVNKVTDNDKGLVYSQTPYKTTKEPILDKNYVLPNLSDEDLEILLPPPDNNNNNDDGNNKNGNKRRLHFPPTTIIKDENDSGVAMASSSSSYRDENDIYVGRDIQSSSSENSYLLNNSNNMMIGSTTTKALPSEKDFRDTSASRGGIVNLFETFNSRSLLGPRFKESKNVFDVQNITVIDLVSPNISPITNSQYHNIHFSSAPPSQIVNNSLNVVQIRSEDIGYVHQHTSSHISPPQQQQPHTEVIVVTDIPRSAYQSKINNNNNSSLHHNNSYDMDSVLATDAFLNAPSPLLPLSVNSVGSFIRSPNALYDQMAAYNRPSMIGPNISAPNHINNNDNNLIAISPNNFYNLGQRTVLNESSNLLKQNIFRGDSIHYDSSVTSQSSNNFTSPEAMTTLHLMVNKNLSTAKTLNSSPSEVSTIFRKINTSNSSLVTSGNSNGKRKRKDPNEPPKPVSAYALFFRDTQAAIKGQNPTATFGEVSKIVASMWDTLDFERKETYKKKTELAKKEYAKKMADYRAKIALKAEENTNNVTGFNDNQLPQSVSLNAQTSQFKTRSKSMKIIKDNIQNSVPKYEIPNNTLSNAQNFHSTFNAPNFMGMDGIGHKIPNLEDMTPLEREKAYIKRFNANIAGQNWANSKANGMIDSRCINTNCAKPALPYFYESLDEGKQNGQGIDPRFRGNEFEKDSTLDGMYCGNRCVVDHCKDIFNHWVLKRKETFAQPNLTGTGNATIVGN